jgi:magnesium and cobalt transporter
VQALEEDLGVKLLDPKEGSDVDTVGGLISTLAGRVPVRGEVIPHPTTGIEFEVLDADRRRVKKLRVHVPSAGPPRGAASAA